MTDEPIRFDDGASYERAMGGWSRLAGEVFIDWVRPVPGLAWIDVGCGNGAFTELLVERAAPVLVSGVDPSEAQINYAGQRHSAGIADFRRGDAMALPFPDKTFDAAVMALVIFFVPEPARSVAEMLRVVRPGGTIAAYVWDVLAGGSPLHPVQEALRESNLPPPLPPSAEIARIDRLAGLWREAGLEQVEVREIVVERRFDDFEAFWDSAILSPAAAMRLNTLTAAQREQVKARARELAGGDGTGQPRFRARANAVKGIVPALRGVSHPARA
jgi:SAM-dependent methyltransferase